MRAVLASKGQPRSKGPLHADPRPASKEQRRDGRGGSRSLASQHEVKAAEHRGASCDEADRAHERERAAALGGLGAGLRADLGREASALLLVLLPDRDEPGRDARPCLLYTSRCV